MKKIILSLANLILIFNLLAQNYNAITWRFVSQQCLKTAQVGVFVKDLNSGKVLTTHNPNMLLIPASVTKLFTTAAALELLGPYYRFQTEIRYSGKIQNSILYGDLIIKGYGDPTLNSRYFPQQDFLNFVKKIIADSLKIKQITGNIIADQSTFATYNTPVKWTWEDLGNYYGATAYALNIFDNTYTITFKTGSTVGAPTEITSIYPKIPNLKIQNFVKSANIRSDQSYIIGAPYCNERIAIGKLPLNRTNFKVKASIPDPSLTLAFHIKQTLQNAGIKINGQPTTSKLSHIPKNTKVIATFYSPTLFEIIQKTNQHSINLFAEAILSTLGYEKYGKGSISTGLQALNHFLAQIGIDTNKNFFYDGSGLSRYNAVTASAVARLLDYMYTSSKFKDEFINSLSIAGQKGTLAYFKKINGKFYGKSGTMKRVRAYAGYLFTKSGKTLAVVVILNNFTCSLSKARKLTENYLYSLSIF